MASSDLAVRRATEFDRYRVVTLLREAHEAASQDWPFKAAYADRQFSEHLARGLVLVLGEPAQGVLMAQTWEHPFGAGLWARETCWYIRPEARGRHALRMLDAYEAWAREQGCSRIHMVSLDDNDVSAIYARRGYAPVEKHFLKAL